MAGGANRERERLATLPQNPVAWPWSRFVLSLVFGKECRFTYTNFNWNFFRMHWCWGIKVFRFFDLFTPMKHAHVTNNEHVLDVTCNWKFVQLPHFTMTIALVSHHTTADLYCMTSISSQQLTLLCEPFQSSQHLLMNKIFLFPLLPHPVNASQETPSTKKTAEKSTPSTRENAKMTTIFLKILNLESYYENPREKKNR